MQTYLRWPLTGKILLLFLCAASLGQTQAAVVCPDPPNKVNVTVNATVTFDPPTQLHTYQYEVFNDPTSLQDVDDFALDFQPPVSAINSPQGWTDGFFDDRSTLHWFASQPLLPPPDAPDTGQVPPPLFPIKPGTSLSGFSFKSPNPPGQVTFYVTGFTPLPSAPSELEVEQLLEDCPAIAGNFFDLAFSATTQGPVSGPGNVLNIQIDIKPGSFPNSINPGNKGVIPVAILTTSTFNATLVDPLSVRFGPGGATEIHNTGHIEDVNGDGKNDLVLHFDTQSSGIHCGDTSASLTGQTFGGQAIKGSDSIVTVGCK